MPVALTEVWEKGGEGGIELAKQVLDVVNTTESDFRPLYKLSASLADKIRTVATMVYGAKDVEFLPKAKKTARRLYAIRLGKASGLYGENAILFIR